MWKLGACSLLAVCSAAGLCPDQAEEATFRIQAYEAVNATDWRTLAAAVAVQPVVIAMVGSQPSFLLYDGVSTVLCSLSFSFLLSWSRYSTVLCRLT